MKRITRTTLMLSLVLAGTACSYPRIPNRYRSDLGGKMLYAEGNDGDLARAVKVSIATVKESGDVRTHVILFENFSRKKQEFEYQTRWYNTLGILAGDPSEWKSVTLDALDQINLTVQQPEISDLVNLEIIVRVPGKK
ncbi:MAG: DUF1425 domain-containing protein [Deltaproteobacteria bacterium]|nr:DUF1425 domain-containing protein [Deltaproteobacteria bacterium]